MAQPNIAQVSIGPNSFRAVGVHFGISTLNNGFPGTPLMGSISCSVLVMVDLNDQVNMPFGTLQSVFNLAYGVTRDKIQDIVLTFWSDDSAPGRHLLLHLPRLDQQLCDHHGHGQKQQQGERSHQPRPHADPAAGTGCE